MAGLTEKYRIWSAAVFLAMITVCAVQGFAEDKKEASVLEQPAEKDNPIPDSNSTVAVKEPNDPNLPVVQTPVQTVMPDPNISKAEAVCPETRHLILSHSVSAVAASNWITQGIESPTPIVPKQGIAMVSETRPLPYWWYQRSWLWDRWYGNSFFPYREYPGGYLNYAGATMSLDASMSFEFGCWSTSYLDGPYYKP